MIKKLQILKGFLWCVLAGFFNELRHLNTDRFYTADTLYFISAAIIYY